MSYITATIWKSWPFSETSYELVCMDPHLKGTIKGNYWVQQHFIQQSCNALFGNIY